MRWEPDTGVELWPWHRRRLARSGRYFGIDPEFAAIERELAALAADGPLRLRLTVQSDGGFDLRRGPLPPGSDGMTLALDDRPVDPGSVWLHHKTTRRERYDEARARRPADADEVLLWNPRREATETTIGNLVADFGRRRLTPPLSCGLLAGTRRQRLLDTGEIEEAVLPLDRLREADALWMVNAVRGWVRLRLIDA